MPVQSNTPQGSPSDLAVAAARAPGAAGPAGPAPLAPVESVPVKSAEFGGPGGPEPTRFGDWERAGRCIDF